MKKINYSLYTKLIVALCVIISPFIINSPQVFGSAFASATVNSTGDEGDDVPGDGSCKTNVSTCTLRAAIEELNAVGAGPHTIDFNIAGSGVQLIQPMSPLPAFSQQITLDGTTQPGALCPTASNPAKLFIHIDGTLAGSADGLVLGAGSDFSTVKGVAIINFAKSGLVIVSDDNTVQCNFIGVEGGGDLAAPNLGDGIQISGDDNVIGGDFGTERNVISANGGHGVYLSQTANINDIFGNIIGLDDPMKFKLGNGGSGIYLFGADNNNIGSITADEGNVISGNDSYGIFLNDDGTDTSSQNDIYNNKIGTNWNSDAGLGNGESGIRGDEAEFNDIGSSANGGSGNEIAGNAAHGVYLTSGGANNNVRFNHMHDNAFDGVKILNGDDHLITHNTIHDNGDSGVDISNGAGVSTGNTISENSIYDNINRGIDLEGDIAVEPNDTGDGDTGPNNLQNYPELFAVGDNAIAVGKLNSVPSRTYTIEFYSSPTCDSSGHGEGQTYVGETNVTTDGSGDVYFTHAFFFDVAVGDTITAIATDLLSGDTSEFSACEQVADAFIVNNAGDDSDNSAGDGTCDITINPGNAVCTLRAAVEEINASGTGKDIYFAIPGVGPHTLSPATSIPSIGEQVTIDALTYEQGADCETGLQVFIDGNALTSSTLDGFNFNGDSAGSTVQGLAIGNFPRSGIRIRRADINVWCNYLGLEADGLTVARNVDGVTVVSDNATIGKSGFPNVISANTDYGIHIDGSAVERSGMTIHNNYVGTDLTKTFNRGNFDDGIYLNNVTNSEVSSNLVSANFIRGIHAKDSDNIMFSGNVVGINGTLTGALGNVNDGLHLDNVQDSYIDGNVIGGNSDGIEIKSSARITVTGNKIGQNNGISPVIIPNVDGIYLENSTQITIGGDPSFQFNNIGGNNISGIHLVDSSFNTIIGNNVGGVLFGVDTGNGSHGIHIQSGSFNQIGDAGFANFISTNGGDGIRIDSATSVENEIRYNAIFDNDSLGIDLNGDGVDMDDVGDVDGGANGTQNFVNLTHASENLGGLAVRANFLTGSGFPYTVDYYSIGSCEVVGNGEGKTYLGSLEIVADVGDFFAVVDVPPVGESQITSIVTDNAGNSSEFSNCQAVIPCTPPAVKNPTLSVSGNDILFDWGSSDNYYIYRSTDPYDTDMPAYGYQPLGSTWTDVGGAGDVATNYYYQTRNRHICISDVSKTVGAFDFEIVPGS